MKSFVLATLLLLSLAFAPQAAEARRVRPLTRYLSATLHLSRRQARAVQVAMAQNPLQYQSPDEMLERLRPVLNEEQRLALLSLTGSVDSYELLHRLARQH